MAWAPPTLNIWSTPALRAATSTAGFAPPAAIGRGAHQLHRTLRERSGHRQHDGGGGQGCRAGGNIQADRADGHTDALADHARVRSPRAAAARVAPHGSGAHCRSRAQWPRAVPRVTARSAAANSCAVTASASRRTPSNCSREREQRGIAFAAHAFHDAARRGVDARGILAAPGAAGLRVCSALDDEFQSRILMRDSA